MSTNPIATKLTAARTKLILDKPFLGALVLRLPLTEAKPDWCPTTATDARGFYYNPEYIQELSLSQTQFMLAHEALHCALSHFARRQHRVKHRWDLACDFAINPLLVEEGLDPPPNALLMDQYKGMTAEEIYPLVEDNEDMETLDQHMYDQDNQTGSTGQSPPPKPDRQDGDGKSERQEESSDGKGGGQKNEFDDQAEGGQDADSQQAPPPPDSPADAPPPLSPDERETLQVQWQQRMAGAAQQAMQAGKLGGALARMVDHLLQPQLPWRMLLAKYLSSAARDDFSYMRPSRREGDAIFPSLRSSQVDIAIAVDTSGSIKRAEMEEFIAEVSALKGQVRARVVLLPCDAKLAQEAPWTFEPWEDCRLPESLRGGGGTDFRPVFEWVESQERVPEVLVYFTDAEGHFPTREPGYPVIWLVKGRTKVPWGQRIQLN